MGNETQSNSTPSSSSSSPSTSSNTSTTSPLPYAVSRESKKYRPPVSIFDLPCPPRCAPPQDDKSFFDRMDSIEKALEEEDAGKIPKVLEAGPEIIVESLNKKRRRLQATEILPAVASHPHPASSPSLSSSSSAQLLDSFSSISSDTLSVSEKSPENNEVLTSRPPAKKVRFRGDVEYRFIEPRPPPSIRRSSRLATIRRRSSRRAGHAVENAIEISPPMLSPRVLTPEMMYQEDDEKKFEDWLNGNTPPPPLWPSIAQQVKADTPDGQPPMMWEETQEAEPLADSQISYDLNSGPDKSEHEKQFHSPSPNCEISRDSQDWGESLPEVGSGIAAMDQSNLTRIGESDGEDICEDNSKNQSGSNNDSNIEISVNGNSESDDASNRENKYNSIGGDNNDENSETNISSNDAQLLEKPYESDTHATHTSSESLVDPPGSLEIISVESSKEFEGLPDNFYSDGGDDSSGNNKDIFEVIPVSVIPSSAVPTKPLHTTTHTTLVEPSVNANGSTGPIDISDTTSASNSKALGRPKKGKDTITSIAAIIGSRRRQTVAQRPLTTGESLILASSTEAENLVKKVRSPHRTVPVINLDEEDHTVGSNLETAKIVLPDQTIIPVSSAESSSTTNQSMYNKEKVDTAKLEPPKSTPGPLSELRLYVIPTNMDSRVFDITRKRVIDLGGSWLGPRVKTLATDPRVKPHVPNLDQENTTHIVTALTSIEDVKRFLSVDEINPKISVVNREWLSDTIMYKTPMESQGYALRKVEPIAPLAPLEDETPPPSQGRTNKETPQQAPDNQWFPKFKSTATGNQIVFNDIVQGIQEGSLEDPETSDIDDDGIVNGDIEEPGNNIEPQAPEEGLEPNEAADPNKLSNDNQQGLTSKMKNELKHENRCFECKEVGHWANRCPHPKPKPKDDEVLLQIINSGKSEGKRRKIIYQCQSPHVADKKDEPKYNKAILEQLKILMDHYDTIKTKDSKEHFKVINYRKAITAIRSLDYEITSEEMALKVPRVGKKIAQKIGECVALGKIKKLDHLNWDKERSEVETLFRSIYGVGSEKAAEWYNKGLRTLDDLRKQQDLTKNQISGLRFYEDLLKRIPRMEVEEIGAIVDKVAKALHPEIQSQVTGSYRRGKPDCGDIDIVVARPNIDDGDALFDIMEHILNELINQGFLVDHLSWPSWSEEMANRPKHFKYMGICKLPGDDKIHRHIDILVVPWIHHGAVLLYFTGNDICNRSMRLFASKRGMHLSDKGLFAGIIRGPKRERVNQGRWVAGRTEREIFEYLGIDYLEPYEREC